MRPCRGREAHVSGVAWWIDRMVRTSRPLVERMTLVWHDWFATSDAGVDSQRLMLNQNQLFREHALGSFPDGVRRPTERTGPDRFPQRLEAGRRHGQLPLRPERTRRRRQDDLPQARRLHLEGLGQARGRAPEPSVVLREQALGLLHPDATGCRNTTRARTRVCRERQSDQARRRGDPQASLGSTRQRGAAAGGSRRTC